MLTGEPYQGRAENDIVHVLSGPPMCEIEDKSTSVRATFFPSTLLPPGLGPLSTVPSTLASEWRYELLSLSSPPSASVSLSFLLSSLADLPSRLTLSFNFLNRFEKDFRRSMSVLDRRRLWQAWRVGELVVLVQDRSVWSAQKPLWMAR